MEDYEYKKQVQAIGKGLTASDTVKITTKLLAINRKKEPWQGLGHGIRLLDTLDDMNAYLAAYGEMHILKCFAALQNFPVKQLTNGVDIVDWGCGQGTATLCLLEYMRERNLLCLINRIILIEPSKSTLERAKLNVETSITGLDINVVAYNRYLPGHNNSVDRVNCMSHVIIDLFSNILDVPDIDVKKTACLVSRYGYRHYIICTGVGNTRASRIDDFCAIFKSAIQFSKICTNCLGYTSNTHHAISCRTNCIYFDKNEHFILDTSISIPGIKEKDVYDDYDAYITGFRSEIEKTTIRIDHLLREYIANVGMNDLHKDSSVYLYPQIELDRPDLVVTSKNCGVLLMVVSDIIPKYEKDKNDKDIIQCPSANRVQTYKQNLITLHSKRFFENALDNKRFWSVVHAVVVFTKHVDSKIINDCQNKFKYVTFLNENEITEAYQFFSACHFSYLNTILCEAPEIINSVNRLILPKWHSYKEGDASMHLSPIQKKLSVSAITGTRKIGGVAGSGKTQVLAYRAVNAQLRTGQTVLILTFNITLVNYIKYRISKVPADYSYGNFHIANYHQFIKAEANNLGIRKFGFFDAPEAFEPVKDRIKKFSCIMIDETQDYINTWLFILRTYFLEPNGEFVFFGDIDQNVYKRTIDPLKGIIIPGVPGEWNKSLNKSFRFKSERLASLSSKFRRHFLGNSDEITISQQSLSLFDEVYIEYAKIDADIDASKMAKWCYQILEKFNSDAKNTVVLGQTYNLLRDIDFYYRQSKSLSTLTTGESYEWWKANKDNPNQMLFKQKLDEMRQNKKRHFIMNAEGLKLSTIYSFKGWEADTVIIFIQPIDDSSAVNLKHKYSIRPDEDNAQLIYTAITRAKKNLFIFNMDNEKYDNFFKTTIRNN